MIIKAKHNPIIHQFFKLYTRWIIKQNFSSTHIVGEFEDRNLPILLISNHVSWWDGFWAFYLNINLFKRRFYFMMLEEQLRKYWYFNYSGGFSIKKKNRSSLESLNYAAELLADRNNAVLVFPQGAIFSQHNQLIRFEKGIERILKNKNQPLQIILLVNLTDYFSNKKPSLYQYIKEYNFKQSEIISIEEQYQAFYLKCIEYQSKFRI